MCRFFKKLFHILGNSPNTRIFGEIKVRQWMHFWCKWRKCEAIAVSIAQTQSEKQPAGLRFKGNTLVLGSYILCLDQRSSLCLDCRFHHIHIGQHTGSKWLQSIRISKCFSLCFKGDCVVNYLPSARGRIGCKRRTRSFIWRTKRTAFPSCWKWIKPKLSPWINICSVSKAALLHINWDVPLAGGLIRSFLLE